jgi:pyruvate/2-oxoglutarate dehydrogenase complex dihydrolipoamide acyltransferase (E2) component
LKLISLLFLSVAMLAACGGGMEEEMPAAEEPAAAPAAPAAPTMTHPEIMQEIAATRTALQTGLDSQDGAAVGEAGRRLQELFTDAVPEYQRRGLADAITIAEGAAQAAADTAAAADAGDFETATTHFAGVTVCGDCHMQFREKTPDQSGYQFKVMN